MQNKEEIKVWVTQIMRGTILFKSEDVRKNIVLFLFSYFLALILIFSFKLLLIYQIYDKLEQVQPKVIDFNIFIIKSVTYLCAGGFLAA